MKRALFLRSVLFDKETIASNSIATSRWYIQIYSCLIGLSTTKL